MKKKVASVLVAALAAFGFFSACDLNAPVKDDMEFYAALKPASSWEELKRAVEEGPGSLIALTQSFSTPAEGEAIKIQRNVTITAINGTKTITRAEGFTAAFFEIYEGGHLTLGHPDGRTLVLDGAKIANRSYLITSAPDEINARFTLEDGAELRNNKGGGVYIRSGKMTMSGGIISGNTTDGGSNQVYNGGGVYIRLGEMTMSGGSISGNTAHRGGGVYFDSSAMTMTLNGGTISGNSASFGGGINIGPYSKMIMNKGTISGNSASESGGGIHIGNAEMTMNGGIISDNSGLGSGGGGVFVNGKMTMNDGIISGNSAPGDSSGNYGYGGGVFFINQNGFQKNGGTVFGKGEGENSNTAADGKGHAVRGAFYDQVNALNITRFRDTTAGPNDDLDSSASDGWEETPPNP